MSKKSYKRLQNRLYREIKRRMIAELPMLKPIQITKCEHKIETIGAACIVPEEISHETKFIKRDLVNQIASKLYEEGYVTIKNSTIYDGFLGGKMQKTEARLQIVIPNIGFGGIYENDT